MTARRAMSPQEQALIDHVEAALSAALPVREGSYALSLTPLPDAQRGEWGGQHGPVVLDSTYVSAHLRFDGLSHHGQPWTIEQTAWICRRDERDLARVTAIVEAFAEVSRRAMRDAADDRFSDQPWLGLTHLAGAMCTLRDAPPRRARTREECAAILCASRDLREILAPPEAEVAAGLEALDRWIEENLTLVKTPEVALVIAREARWDTPARVSPQGVEVKRAGLFVTLELVVYDEGTVRDIKQQQLRFVPSAQLAEMPRVIAFLDGWAEALRRAFEKTAAKTAGARGAPRWRKEIEFALPHDLFDEGVLALKRPRSAGDFAEAFARRWKLG